MSPRKKPLYPYVVSVKGGVETAANMTTEHGDEVPEFEEGAYSLSITGSVCVVAANKREAEARAFDVLLGPPPKVHEVSDGRIVDYGSGASGAARVRELEGELRSERARIERLLEAARPPGPHNDLCADRDCRWCRSVTQP